MSYFKNKTHFENFLRKVIRENGHLLDRDQILRFGAYWEAVFKSNLADDFGLAVKNTPTLIHENDFWQWMRDTQFGGFSIDTDIEHIVTAEFVEAIESLRHLPGVYSFWNSSGMPLYVGVSIDLASRIQSSFSERFRAYDKVVYLRYIVTNTATDARVYEAAFIGALKPALNTAGKYADALTIDIALPSLGDSVAVNLPGKKVWHPELGKAIVAEDQTNVE